MKNFYRTKKIIKICLSIIFYEWQNLTNLCAFAVLFIFTVDKSSLNQFVGKQFLKKNPQFPTSTQKLVKTENRKEVIWWVNIAIVRPDDTMKIIFLHVYLSHNRKSHLIIISVSLFHKMLKPNWIQVDVKRRKENVENWKSILNEKARKIVRLLIFQFLF